MYKSEKYNDSRPNVGVTVVPFIYEDNKVKTLIYKRSKDSEVFPDMYALPNTFFDIKLFKTLEESAEFALAEKTSVVLQHLEQIHTFSGLEIDPRICTVNSCYLSICKKNEIVFLDQNKFEHEWIDIDKALKLNLAFNHSEVLVLAYQRLKAKAEYTPLSALLLEDNFTISQFRELVEYLIDKKLDNSRFRDRVKKTDVLIQVNEQFKTGANRPAQLYRLNKEYKDFFYPMSLTKPN